MDANSHRGTLVADDPSRPIAFLISTTGCARDIRRHMGSADYSYTFVLDALRPILERLGTCEWIPQPESQLAFAAARAARAGKRPVHLALHPVHNIYATPGVASILFPFWEFPEIPNRDFGFDTRQNWARMSRTAGLIVTASRECGEAFERAGIHRPRAVIPVPVSPEYFAVPDWDPRFSWTLTCRHRIWGGEPSSASAGDNASSEQTPSPSLRRRLTHAVRSGYRHYVCPWLSEHALRTLALTKRKILRRPEPTLPLLPSSPLTLEGLVFTSIFNLSDRRKNAHDLLTAFLLAFRDRPDVTLVLKLATSPAREAIEMQALEAAYRGLGIDHACRVVVLTDFLSEAQMLELLRVTTFYVNTSHAEGACLPLQRALAAGRPAIAPRHTAMSDYMDETVGLLVRSHPEPTFWPQDPERRFETSWHRMVWEDVHDHLRRAADLAESEGLAYRSLSVQARRRMSEFASEDTVLRKWRDALKMIEAPTTGSLDWAA